MQVEKECELRRSASREGESREGVRCASREGVRVEGVRVEKECE